MVISSINNAMCRREGEITLNKRLFHLYYYVPIQGCFALMVTNSEGKIFTESAKLV